MYGTAYYIAPEVLKGNYTEKCDLWSIGVILYIMLCGTPPFTGRTDKDILNKVSNAGYSLQGELWRKRSDGSKDLIKKLMERDPDKRLSAVQALKHSWLQRKVHTEFDVDLAKETIANLKDFRVSQISN